MTTNDLIKKQVETKHKKDLHTVGLLEDGTPIIRWVGLISPELEEITKVKRAAVRFYKTSPTTVTNLSTVVFTGLAEGDKVARTALFEFSDSTEPLDVSYIFDNGICTMRAEGLFLINAGDLEMRVFK